MRKLFLLVTLILSIESFTQNQTAKTFVGNFNELYSIYDKNIELSLRENFSQELMDAKSQGEVGEISKKYFNDNVADLFTTKYLQFIESATNLAKSGSSKDEIYLVFKEGVDNPIFPCRDKSGYDKCMTGVNDEYVGAATDFAFELGLTALGVLATEGGYSIVAWGVVGNAWRKMSNAADKRQKGTANCFDTHCGNGGGAQGSGMPSGGIPKSASEIK